MKLKPTMRYVHRPMRDPSLLATDRQVYFLVKEGYDRDRATMMTRAEAQLAIGDIMYARKQAAREAQEAES